MDEQTNATSRYDLPSVVRDLVVRLIDDDWVRLRSEDGRDAYYVLRAAAWWREIERKRTYDMELRKRTRISPIGEHLVRAAIAAVSSDSFVKQAGERLERSGITIEKVTALLAHKGDPEPWPPISDEGRDALADYLEALLAVRAVRGEFDLDADLLQEVGVAREKLYLREMAARYSKVVKRSALLEPLGFVDLQLQEASQCYLYGFYRAAITMAAASLEGHLKNRLGVQSFETYSRLVNDAWTQGLLGSDAALVEASDEVFSKRNAVVHKTFAPNKSDAETILALARRVVAHLLEASPAGA
jgi:hypothetical protein